MLFRILLLAAAAGVVTLLLTYSLSRNRRNLGWALWVAKVTFGLTLLFAILYVLERVILI